ncbi:MAG: hypothetical protein LBJ63_07205 [Prevotellaceae bacterium]|jgi:hypothetical protein|nr:hypothetical protein [Prevotellaceae bacterium]
MAKKGMSADLRAGKMKFRWLAFLGLLCLLLSCGISKDELTRQVQESIVETYRERGNSNLEVVNDLQLVKKSKTEYTGFIELDLKDPFDLFPVTERLSVNVIFDGKSFQWTAQ